MFTTKTFDNTSNTVAFKPDTFKIPQFKPWDLRNRQHVYSYEVEGIWVSSKSNTKGSLVFGSVVFSFVGEQYADLNFGDLLVYGRSEKNPDAPHQERVIRDVSYNAHILVGNGNVWAGLRKNMERTLMFLLETYFALPNSPAGYTDWLTQKNKDS